MTGQEFLKFHSDTLDKMKAVCAAKNNDYAGGKGNADAFANFRLVEIFGAASSEQGFFTRMTDKMSRISTFIQKGMLLVKDETVEDTLIDLANYCILFAGFLRSKRINAAATKQVNDVANAVMRPSIQKGKSYKFSETDDYDGTMEKAFNETKEILEKNDAKESSALEDILDPRKPLNLQKLLKEVKSGETKGLGHFVLPTWAAVRILEQAISG